MSDAINITFITADQQRFSISGTLGSSLMETAIANNVPGIEAECGGACACATCHVFVPSSLAAPNDDLEDVMLDEVAVTRQSNSRLACQIELSTDLQDAVFHLPERQI